MKALSFLSLCLLFVISSSCKKEEWSAIEFFTIDETHDFYLNGTELEPDTKPGLGTHYYPSSGGKSTVSIDYYTPYKGKIYTSLKDLAGSDPNVILGDPFVLHATEEKDPGTDKYSVYLNGPADAPHWENTNLDDINTPCFVGSWKRTACGQYNEYIYLYASNRGSHELEDCTGQCSAVNEFIWSDKGGSMEWHYTAAYGCGVVVDPPKDVTQSYSCDGNTFTISGASFTSF